MTERPWHCEAWQQWRSAMGGDRMHHAWLLAGKKGLGKAEFARNAARELVREDGLPQPEGDHPDILHLVRAPADQKEADKKADGKPFKRKRNIAVDQVRAMQARLSTRPTLGSRRAIIIDPADDMEKGAANALLKSLEEPPQGTFFLLIAHRPGRLLPTIRSRCRILNFKPLTEAEMREALGDGEPQALEAAISVAAGSPGAAREFLSQDFAGVERLMRELAEHGDPRMVARSKLSAALGPRPDRDKQLATIELARSVLAGRMRSVEKAGIPRLVEAHEALNRLAAQAPTYNFDPGLLAMEIGTLLASAAPPSEPLHG